MSRLRAAISRHDCLPPLAVTSALAPPIGGPDEFGYTWNNKEAYAWKVAGQDSGIGGDDATGQLEIGFPFKFYEKEYGQVYASTNGILIFAEGNTGCSGGYCGGFPLPLPNVPNAGKASRGLRPAHA